MHLLTFITSECKEDFTVYFEHNAEGATPYPTVRSVEECASLCRAVPQCVAFDYDRNDPPFENSKCWIHSDVNIVMKKQHAVDHHIKRSCQGNLILKFDERI